MKKTQLPLENKTILITGAARRVGRLLALAAARGGADVVIHHAASPEAAWQTASEVEALGRRAWVIQCDFGKPETAPALIEAAWDCAPLDALVNNAAIFEPLGWADTGLDDWQKHLDINLTAPFLLSQAFARHLPADRQGRIVNILDWRALRPGKDHLPYTISKAGLAALTQALAQALAPQITVNGLALGAMLPPSDGASTDGVLQNVPMQRWAKPEELEKALIFLLSGPAYITGEIVHLDGGRHVV
ncbi:MAG TPA: SDR family oxidoreductase [Anaerolineaceae bacterium]|nr:SDR family oxidoreductase [Anaerolineaceae bacterium]